MVVGVVRGNQGIGSKGNEEIRNRGNDGGSKEELRLGK